MTIKNKQAVDLILSFTNPDYKISKRSKLIDKFRYWHRNKKALAILSTILIDRGYNPNADWIVDANDDELICYINDQEHGIHIKLSNLDNNFKKIEFIKNNKSDVYKYRIIDQNIKFIKKIKSKITLENSNIMEIEFAKDFNVINYTFANNNLKIVLDKQFYDINIIKELLENLESPTNVLAIYQKLKELIIMPGFFIKGICLNNDYIIWNKDKIVGVNITRYGHNIYYKNNSWSYQGPLVKANYTQDNLDVQSLSILDRDYSIDNIANDVIKSIDVIKRVRKKIEEES